MAINFIPLAQQNLSTQSQILAQTNTNFATLATLLTDALSISGQLPNQMQSTLDMNSNPIINLPPPLTTSSPARLIDVVSNPSIVVPTVGTSGATVPLLNANNTFSGNTTFSGSVTLTNAANVLTASTFSVSGALGLNSQATYSGVTATITTICSVLIPSGTMTVTLPVPSLAGQVLFLLSNNAQIVNSATANIQSLIGATQSAIFPATAGKWCMLVWNGTLWQITASN